jgi:hypothetical protein
VNLTLLVVAEVAPGTPTACEVQVSVKVPLALPGTAPADQVVLQVQFCTKTDYDICEQEAHHEQAQDEEEVEEVFERDMVVVEKQEREEKVEEVRGRGGSFDEFPVTDVTDGWRAAEGTPPEVRVEVVVEVEGPRAVASKGVKGEREVQLVPVEKEALLDRIRVALFSPSSAPVTIAVLAVLLASSLAGLACLHCRGRLRAARPPGLRAPCAKRPSSPAPSLSVSYSTCSSSSSSSGSSRPVSTLSSISEDNDQPRCFAKNLVCSK